MAKLCSMLLLTLSSLSAVLAQENSTDESTGNWIDNSTWQDGSAPATSNVEGEIYINGLVTAPTLDFKSNSASLFIEDGDTLIVDGDMIMNDGNGISVGDNAVLVVIGDFSANDFLTVANTGILLILGQLSVNTDANIFSSGNMYLLGGHNLEDEDFPSSTVNNSVDGIEELNDDEEDLIIFLDNNYGTALPVDLVYFSVNPSSEEVIIEWATASEQENAYFIIERAGSKMSFEEIEKVEGQGNSNHYVSYKSVDSNPGRGLRYYRLKQVDFDGNYKYHPTVAVWIEIHSNFLVSPNPSKDGVYRCKITEQIRKAEYIDMFGKNHKGVIAYTDTMPTVTPQNHLKSGHYIIRLQTNNQIYIGNLLIQ